MCHVSRSARSASLPYQQDCQASREWHLNRRKGGERKGADRKRAERKGAERKVADTHTSRLRQNVVRVQERRIAIKGFKRPPWSGAITTNSNSKPPWSGLSAKLSNMGPLRDVLTIWLKGKRPWTYHSTGYPHSKPPWSGSPRHSVPEE